MPATEEMDAQILLVDSTDSLIRRLRSTLADAGFALTVVESGGDCLSYIEENPVDGIVSRQTLPDLNGIQLLRSIRISYPSLPFILAPEDGSESLAGAAISAGASGYVGQTDDPETVCARLQDSLNRDIETQDGDEGHHRYRHLIEMSPAPINVFDETGTSIWCNDAVIDLLGLDSREELIGRSIFDVIHPDDQSLAHQEMKTVVDEKKSTGPTQMKLHPPNKGVRYIRVSTAIGSFLGNDIGQAIAVDLTDRVERNRQLQILDQWLRHNIRNEMAVIQAIADSIQQGIITDEIAAAERIEDHADRLIEQVNHEREIISILAPTTDREPVPIEMTDVIDQQIAACRDQYPAATIDLLCRDEIEVIALPGIETAVKELILNAIQHNDTEQPTVEVEIVWKSSDQGEIRVADNGPGIPAAERECLLLDEEIDQLNHNSGLGLVLVYWVVRLSNGEITFEENDPRGSIVTLTLPLHD